MNGGSPHEIPIDSEYLNEELIRSLAAALRYDGRKHEGEPLNNNNNNGDNQLIPLKQWKDVDDVKPSHPSQFLSMVNKKASLVRKVTIAYAVANLLQHLSEEQYSIEEIERLCLIDNFVVRLCTNDLGWEVSYLYLVPLQISVEIELHKSSDDPSSAAAAASGSTNDCISGRDVDVTIAQSADQEVIREDNVPHDERLLCNLAGRFLHSFFSGRELSSVTSEGDDPKEAISSQPDDDTCDNLSIDELSQSRRKKSVYPGQLSDNSPEKMFTPLSQLGYPSALSQTIIDSLDILCCTDDLCLEEIILDLRIFLHDPERFLFDQYPLSSSIKRIPFHVDKLYDRCDEIRQMQEKLYEVVETGQSAAISITGFSGSGKTTLVQQSLFEPVVAAGGYVVQKKFDETSRNCFYVILSAIDDLAAQLVLKLPQEERDDLFTRIKDGTDLPFISTVFKSLSRIDSSDAADRPRPDIISGLNYHRLVFAVKKLLRIISSKSRPVMFFFDDIQWANAESLDLMRCMMDGDDVTILMVGCCRKEVATGIPKFVTQFFRVLDILSRIRKVTYIELDDLGEEDLNLMISDAIGVLPRRSQSLSSILFSKTGGNPFFSIKFLETLIDSDYVKYSLLERRWLWSVDMIGEQDIADNVLELITTKMNELDTEDKKAIAVVSCFGIKIRQSIVKILSESKPFQHFSLERAIDFGLMNYDGTNYKFVHDRVREAAYCLIESTGVRHYDIGITLYSSLRDSNMELGDLLPTILEQLNHGVPSLVKCPNDQASIAELNYKESIRASDCCDFGSALFFGEKSVSLLPKDKWTNNHKKYLYQLAAASVHNGHIHKAITSLHTIIAQEKENKDNIDAHILLAKITFLCRKDLPTSFGMLSNILAILGEFIPNKDDAIRRTSHQRSKTKLMMMNSEMSHYIKTEDWKKHAIMESYSLLSTVALLSYPKLQPYICSKWAEFAWCNRIACRFTSESIISFGAVLLRNREDGKLSWDSENARLGYKLAKQGLQFLSGSAPEDGPKTFWLYYGFVGLVFEPLQACKDMHLMAYRLALQTGQRETAVAHKFGIMILNLTVGHNLQDFLKEIDADLESSHLLPARMQFYRSTALKLIGEQPAGNALDHNKSDFANDVTLVDIWCMVEILVSTYLNNPERVFHLLSIYVSKSDSEKLMPAIYIPFLSGIAAAAMYRKKANEQYYEHLIQSNKIFTELASFSEWNWKNKAALLEAELASAVEDNSDKAERQYDVSIAAAQSSKFIQEEALACELAANHCKHSGNVYKALDLFHQAQKCYFKWGSTIKANHMTKEILSLKSVMRGLDDSGETLTLTEYVHGLNRPLCERK